MTFQNRVDPWGRLHAVSVRGEYMGNRGILHNEQQQIVTQWRHKSWVTCEREFKDRQRKVFSPGSYTELFFLDEATAFSAGHRPCAECRRARYNEFKALWCSANLETNSPKSVPISKIDELLHSERVNNDGKITFQMEFGAVPEGAFIDMNGTAFLLWQGHLHQWSYQGYSQSDLILSPSAVVTVLTPASIVRLFSKGFKPLVHESAGS
ncbi:hypothetical protein [Thiofilum flexile]|uniref:hypothetical protein n=1 Tax=Thiofilum flexile TaxID=125627 RepID=UPI0003716C62|nr:hypothetical protein [Thiofilum flexile]